MGCTVDSEQNLSFKLFVLQVGIRNAAVAFDLIGHFVGFVFHSYGRVSVLHAGMTGRNACACCPRAGCVLQFQHRLVCE